MLANSATQHHLRLFNCVYSLSLSLFVGKCFFKPRSSFLVLLKTWTRPNFIPLEKSIPFTCRSWSWFGQSSCSPANFHWAFNSLGQMRLEKLRRVVSHWYIPQKQSYLGTFFKLNYGITLPKVWQIHEESCKVFLLIWTRVCTIKPCLTFGLRGKTCSEGCKVLHTALSIQPVHQLKLDWRQRHSQGCYLRIVFCRPILSWKTPSLFYLATWLPSCFHQRIHLRMTCFLTLCK